MPEDSTEKLQPSLQETLVSIKNTALKLASCGQSIDSLPGDLNETEKQEAHSRQIAFLNEPDGHQITVTYDHKTKDSLNPARPLATITIEDPRRIIEETRTYALYKDIHSEKLFLDGGKVGPLEDPFPSDATRGEIIAHNKPFMEKILAEPEEIKIRRFKGIQTASEQETKELLKRMQALYESNPQETQSSEAKPSVNRRGLWQTLKSKLKK